jgi:hypothetical protein
MCGLPPVPQTPPLRGFFASRHGAEDSLEVAFRATQGSNPNGGRDAGGRSLPSKGLSRRRVRLRPHDAPRAPRLRRSRRSPAGVGDAAQHRPHRDLRRCRGLRRAQPPHPVGVAGGPRRHAELHRDRGERRRLRLAARPSHAVAAPLAVIGGAWPSPAARSSRAPSGRRAPCARVGPARLPCARRASRRRACRARPGWP